MTRVAFFFDRSFPRRIARMIVQYEVHYETRYQDDDPRFQPDMLDVDIIDILAADPEYRWVMVSKDRKVTTRPASGLFWTEPSSSTCTAKGRLGHGRMITNRRGSSCGCGPRSCSGC